MLMCLLKGCLDGAFLHRFKLQYAVVQHMKCMSAKHVKSSLSDLQALAALEPPAPEDAEAEAAAAAGAVHELEAIVAALQARIAQLQAQGLQVAETDARLEHDGWAGAGAGACSAPSQRASQGIGSGSRLASSPSQVLVPDSAETNP